MFYDRRVLCHAEEALGFQEMLFYIIIRSRIEETLAKI